MITKIRIIFISFITLIIGGIIGFYIKSNFFNKVKFSELQYVTNNQNITPINILEENIIKKGDINSYIELRTLYIDKNMFTFLPWALIMANKYQNKDGYFDVYACLFDMNCQKLYNIGIECLVSELFDNSTICNRVSKKSS